MSFHKSNDHKDSVLGEVWNQAQKEEGVSYKYMTKLAIIIILRLIYYSIMDFLFPI